MFARTSMSVLIVLARVGCAHAQDASGCEKFKWSLARERAWLAAGPKPIEAGAQAPVAQVAYAVKLVPSDKAGFVAPPERAPKPGTFAAVLKIPDVKAGLYEITLSDEAWVDVAQNGRTVKSTDFSGQKSCPGARKSVRFDLEAGPATLQISNAATATINLEIAPAQ